MSLTFIFLIFFLWTIFKVFVEFVTILLLFYILVFLGCKHVESKLLNQGLSLYSLHWKVKSELLAHHGGPCRCPFPECSTWRQSLNWSHFSMPQNFTCCLAPPQAPGRNPLNSSLGRASGSSIQQPFNIYQIFNIRQWPSFRCFMERSVAVNILVCREAWGAETRKVFKNFYWSIIDLQYGICLWFRANWFTFAKLAI